MMELIQAAISPVNLVLTVPLMLMVLYWITVIAGVLDVDFLNIELPDSGLEIDADVDFDLDADGEVDLGAEAGGLGRSILHFFYVGEVPIMVLSSILILCLWTISMLSNHYLNPRGSLLIAAGMFIGNAAASLFICKVIAMPLRRVYLSMEKDRNAPRDVLGRICVVVTTSVYEKIGQAEVKTRGAPSVLNVVAEDDHVFKKGDEAVVTGKDKQRGVYTIAPVNLERWSC